MKKKLLVLIICFLYFGNLTAQDDGAGGVSFTMGYSPFQTLESEGMIKTDGKTIHADLQGYYGIGGGERWIDFGIIGGIGIRSYKTDGFRTFAKDPAKKRTTRFDLHVGPALYAGMPEYAIGVMLHPQAGLGYAGFSENALKVYFDLSLNADIIIYHWVTIGVTYRPLSHTIYSFVNDPHFPQSTAHFIRPAFEFRAGLFIIFGDF